MSHGRFVVDTHVHGQRHGMGFSEKPEDASYQTLSKRMREAVPADEMDDNYDGPFVYPNTDRIVYDMDTYGVDRCVLLPAFGMDNRIHREMVQENPDRFVAFCQAQDTLKRAIRGEEEWTIEAACAELDDLLRHDEFRGIGEAMPTDHTRTERMSWDERKDELRQVFEVAADHDVPVSWHTGRIAGYGGGRSPFDLYPDWRDPTYARDLLAEFPEVDLIFDHGGMQGSWHDETVDKACEVAASFDNVYLEIGLYWADLLKKPLNDPNIGLDQLLWGTDWGASMVAHSQPNEEPPMYWEQVQERGLPAHQVDYWGTAFAQIEKYRLENDLPQDELNMILGGNACRLLDIEPPLTRMFPEYI